MDKRVLAELAAAPDAVALAFRQFPKDAWNWKPESWEASPAEHFSALGHLCHLRDIEIDGYHQRFRRTLKEDVPDLPSLDGHRLETERAYESQDPEFVLAAFQEARQQTLQMLNAISDLDYERRAIFAEYGNLSLRGLVHLLCSHDQQHLSGLHWLLYRVHAGR